MADLPFDPNAFHSPAFSYFGGTDVRCFWVCSRCFACVMEQGDDDLARLQHTRWHNDILDAIDGAS